MASTAVSISGAADASVVLARSLSRRGAVLGMFCSEGKDRTTAAGEEGGAGRSEVHAEVSWAMPHDCS